MLSTTLALFLAIAPPDSAPAPASASASEPASNSDYTDAASQLEDKSLAAANSVDPESLAALADALARMDAHALTLADDEAGRRSVTMARLNLARGYLKAGDQAAAERELDRLLRESLGVEVPAGRFGPELNKLFKARKAALDAAGKGTLTIVCHTPCELLLGSSRVQPDAPILHELFLGAYQLRVSALDGSVAVLEQSVELAQPGEAVVIEFAAPPPPEPEPIPEPEPEPVPAPVIEPPPPAPVVAPVKRILPRGIEIDGLLLGSGLIIAGGVMLAYDGHCPQPSADPTSCPKIWESTAGGAVSLGLGGALWIASAVLLAIDEQRVDSSKRQLARFELGRVRF